MSIISTETVFRGVRIEAPARSTLLTVSIGDNRVALTKWQALLLADYLKEDAEGLDD